MATELDPPHRWRKPGTHFAVQEILVDSSRPVQFRLEADDGSPAIIDAHHFEVVDGSIPSTWSANELEPGAYTFGPREWRVPGFWERWLDKEPGAQALYDQFRRTLANPAE